MQYRVSKFHISQNSACPKRARLCRPLWSRAAGRTHALGYGPQARRFEHCGLFWTRGERGRRGKAALMQRRKSRHGCAIRKEARMAARVQAWAGKGISSRRIYDEWHIDSPGLPPISDKSRHLKRKGRLCLDLPPIPGKSRHIKQERHYA